MGLAAALGVRRIAGSGSSPAIYGPWIRTTLRRIAFQQISRPGGRLAPLTARVLNRINGWHNEAAVSRLGGDDALVVDLGFGGGVGIAALHREARRLVVGIDPSVEMGQHCRRRFRKAIESGQLTVVQGVAEHLPLPANSVDAVMTVHSIYYWSDWVAGLGEAARVVKDNGLCIVGVGPNASAHAQRLGLDGVGFRAPAVHDIEAALRQVGFGSTHVEPLEAFTVLTGRL